MKKLIFLIVLCFCFSFVTSVAFANELNSIQAEIEFNQTPDNDELITDPEKIQERKELVKNEVIKILKKSKDMKKVEKWLLDSGFIKIEPDIVEPDTEVGILSANNNVTYNVDVYYDTMTDDYTVYGEWFWNDCAWSSDVPAFGGNVGGNDGVALWFSNNNDLTMVNGSAYLLMNSYTGYWGQTSTPWDWDQNGVAFKYQDRSWVSGTPCNYDYNFDSGYVSVTLTADTPCSSYLKVSYGHDWNTTDLSSVTISSSGVSFTFTKTTDKWQGTSNTYTHTFSN